MKRGCATVRETTAVVSGPAMFWIYLRASVTHQRDSAAASYFFFVIGGIRNIYVGQDVSHYM